MRGESTRTRAAMWTAGLSLAAALSSLACGGGGSGGADLGKGGDGGATADAAGPELEVTIAEGVVAGTVDGDTRAFLGIPYAAPPTGGNRFRSPQPAPAFSGTLDASQYRPQCPQFSSGTGTYDDTTSEDCLTLNVWTPSVVSAPRPVMVWLHGGAFVIGSGSEATYVGEHLSEAGDAVIVTINYRLGPLGFLALPELDAEDPARPASGNYGIEDQRQALRWVRENIAAFGGDPGNVTLFGESAGGVSTCVHLVSPESQGLYHKVIAESPFCTLLTSTSKAVVEAQGQKLETAAGCTGATAAERLACLRALTPEQLLTTLPLKQGFLFGDAASWGPSIDGVNLTDSPAKLIAAGQGAKVPMIVGANGDEATIFFALGGVTVPDDAAYLALVSGLLPAMNAAAVVAQYPSKSYASPQDAAIHALDDVIACDARRTARLQSAAGNATYYYQFTRAFHFIYPNLGAFHSAELPFVWGNPFAYIALSPEELPLSAAMQGYWTRFAAAGDPNQGAPAATVSWPAYGAATDQNLHLDLTISTDTNLRKAACDFWDQLGQ